MKTTILILIFTIFSYNNDIKNIRVLFLSAHKSESNCDKFGKELNRIDIKRNALIQGYQACYYFIKCKHITNPINKLSLFNKGKKLLESAIQEDPQSIELSLLRYCIQKKLPRVLLYYDNLEKDLIFVNENMINIKDKATKDFVVYSLSTINI